MHITVTSNFPKVYDDGIEEVQSPYLEENGEMNRKLASIQKVINIEPIKNADRIELVSVLGWKVVAKKGDFKVGDLAVYFEIDSLIPRRPWNDFLADKNNPDKPIRLRSVRFRGQLSQGLLISLSDMEKHEAAFASSNSVDGDFPPFEEGRDVTSILRVEKYEQPIPAQLSGEAKGARPSYTPKTDEHRVQAYPGVIEEFLGRDVIVTQKLDGASSTIALMDGEEDVCGRKWSLKEAPGNTHWKLARKYNVLETLKEIKEEHGLNLGIQGEACGPGIQGNKLRLKEHDFFAFNVIDLNGVKYYDLDDFLWVCELIDIPMVPTLYIGEFTWKSVEELLEFAKGEYENSAGEGDNPQEGIVIRPLKGFRSEALGSRASFKVINNDFLLKWKNE